MSEAKVRLVDEKAKVPPPPSPMAERLALEIKHSPTHIMDETGIHKIKAKPAPPSPVQVSMMEDPQFMLTGLAWAAADMAFKVDVAVEMGSPTDWAFREDIFDVLPEQTKTWLQGWQMQINSGACWRSAGSIGRTADGLIDAGYLLCSKEPTKSYYGQAIPTRSDARAGMPGSPGFVEAVMGKRYLDWIAAV